MSLENIDVFIEVVEAKSFTRAAKRLCMPLSTVSARVARLEQRLGVTLLQRTTRQITVTPMGQKYYEHCVRALSEVTYAEKVLTESKEEVKGKLRITAPADLANFVLIPLIKRFQELYPKVSVDLMINNHHVDLISENIDLAIRVGPLEDSTLIAKKFFDSYLGLWASTHYLEHNNEPKKITDLASHTLIWLSFLRQGVTLFDSNKKPFQMSATEKLSTDDVQNCQMLVANGAGIGILPGFIGNSAFNCAPLKPVLANLRSQSFSAYFVYPTQRFVPLSVTKFIALAMAKESGSTNKPLF